MLPDQTFIPGCEHQVTESNFDTPEEHLLGQFIPLHYHFNMLRDQSRMLPFREAIQLTVPSGGTVLELGGGTGVLSWFAAQKAGRVWCVERNPAMARAARSFLSQNRHGDRVTVVQADAMTYLPPEPVDVVICEMLHVGMVREKQLEVIHSFRERYQKKFGPKLPQFIPDTSVLLIQPVNQDYSFSGYVAHVPIFEPTGPHMQDRWLAHPHTYSTIDYAVHVPQSFHVDVRVAIQQDGCWNAISFLTNNFLAFVLSERRGIQWLMNQLILPLPEPFNVQAGDAVSIRFNYRAGCSIEDLQQAIRVAVESRAAAHAISGRAADSEQRHAA
jgi:protein arginine N-methyltransferase 1